MFTDKEKAIMDKIVEAHNLFCELDPEFASESQDWVDGIRRLQYVMGMRLARRSDPYFTGPKQEEEKFASENIPVAEEPVDQLPELWAVRLNQSNADYILQIFDQCCPNDFPASKATNYLQALSGQFGFLHSKDVSTAINGAKFSDTLHEGFELLSYSKFRELTKHFEYFPSVWCIQITIENIDRLNDWLKFRNSHGVVGIGTSNIGWYFHRTGEANNICPVPQSDLITDEMFVKKYCNGEDRM